MIDPSHGLTAANMLRVFPEALKQDPGMLALASAVAAILEQRHEEIERLRIYTQIDSLPNELLDILAFDFKVDWWDYNYTLEEKRQTLKDSWMVHRRLGTKYAVETAISAVYPHTKAIEWFEYDGKPYHFLLQINITNDTVDSERHRRVLERVAYYKNLRSRLDGVEYVDIGGNVTPYFAATITGMDMIDSAVAVRY